jgi:signal recognition particle GTPase
MKHIRKQKTQSAWTSETVTEVVRFLGDALLEADVKDIPTETIRKR